MLNLQGVITALITPFAKSGIDIEAYSNLVKFQVKSGVSGIVVNGSTAESLCMSLEEKIQCLEISLENSPENFPVIAGVGSACTSEAVDLAKKYQKAGAKALMVVMPFYNRPPAEGVNKHFEAVSEAVDIPIMLYNVPSRTASDITNESVRYLSSLPNVFSIKDASGDVSRVKRYKDINKDLLVFSGEDGLFLDYLSKNADGIVSVVSNLIPNLWTEIYKIHSSNLDMAKTKFAQLESFLEALSVSTNPIPIKYCMYRVGMCKEIYRLPLTPLDDNNKKIIDNALLNLGLI